MMHCYTAVVAAFGCLLLSSSYLMAIGLAYLAYCEGIAVTAFCLFRAGGAFGGGLIFAPF